MPQFNFYFIVLLTLLVVSACSFFNPQLPKRDISLVSSNQRSPVEVHLVQHAMGQTLVPVHPQRVVVIQEFLVQIPLALGVKLVGAPSPSLTLQGLGSDYQHLGIEDIGAPFSPTNLEKIMTLKPDLILGTIDENRDNYNLLSHIAPTVLVKMRNSADWKEPFISAANALGKTETAKRVIDKYHARLSEFKEKMGSRLKKTQVSVVQLTTRLIRATTKSSFSGVILEDAGLIRPPSQNLDEIGTRKKGGSPVNYRVSPEVLSQIDGDVLFILLHGFKDVSESNSVLHQLMAEPLWSKLNVVRRGKIHIVDEYCWLCGSYLSVNRVLDDLFTYLVKG
ncbi:hypothetical protein CDG77_25465 [Nostoc sp. 'Peltigera membranacea cyanobiont' 213]|uniref:ABC transporter substrate-binding protein n=1 Tax=Nostoc sp. 'Peltigera membranacea cyanobiont' 213 TaxID=2014530 RepID=UPI000B950B16|nr:iron-siderophore ABC transporter substrate-binding protein [Nostoc sp. 'Peltigera membranacea cyanobiont' 213]OYD88134.1 hypothetical protein CDG77_25465 [Nostoc sp. 'Peltigera membranacea cyanobiont' 213]